MFLARNSCYLLTRPPQVRRVRRQSRHSVLQVAAPCVIGAARVSLAIARSSCTIASTRARGPSNAPFVGESFHRREIWRIIWLNMYKNRKIKGSSEGNRPMYRSLGLSINYNGLLGEEWSYKCSIFMVYFFITLKLLSLPVITAFKWLLD